MRSLGDAVGWLPERPLTETITDVWRDVAVAPAGSPAG